MSDKKRTYIAEVEMEDVLPAENGAKYPVNTLMNLYVATHADPEGFAEKLGVSKAILERYIKAFKWDELRERYLSNQLMMIHKLREESITEEIQLDQKEQMFRRFQRMQYLDNVEQYMKTHGHLFVMDETGQIVTNHYGMPVLIPIGHDESSKYRKEIMGNIELQLKVLKDAGLLGKRPIRVTPGGTTTISTTATEAPAADEPKNQLKAFLKSEP